MDVIEIVRRKVEALGEGNSSPGLGAVIRHIEIAAKHLQRGQDTLDESAFTDAIYRTNQAFEGSLKEAYKVLANKDESKDNLYAIETYLQKKSILKPRVLKQFTNYRQEWRNPSTHDYTLEFDESEAFLAIVSICAFTNVLTDQISQQLTSRRVAEAFTKNSVNIRKHIDQANPSFLNKVIELLKEFVHTYEIDDDLKPLRTNELVGALAGFFSTTAPELEVEIEKRLSASSAKRADLIITEGSSKVIVEVKARYTQGTANTGVAQLTNYIDISGIKAAILFIYDPQSKVIKRTNKQLPSQDGEIVIISPLHLELS